MSVRENDPGVISIDITDAHVDFVPGNTEARLEEILYRNGPRLGVCWLMRQHITSIGTRPDLIGIREDGTVSVFELKRGRAGMEIVRQAEGYADWVADVSYSEIENSTLSKYNTKHRRLTDFLSEYFVKTISREVINHRQEIVLVAESFSRNVIDFINRSSESEYNCRGYSFERAQKDDKIYINLTPPTAIPTGEWSAALPVKSDGTQPPIPWGTSDSSPVVLAVSLTEKRVSDLTKAGLLVRGRNGRLIWVHRNNFLVFEIDLKSAGRVGVDIAFSSVVEPSNSNLYFRLMLCKRRSKSEAGGVVKV